MKDLDDVANTQFSVEEQTENSQPRAIAESPEHQVDLLRCLHQRFFGCQFYPLIPQVYRAAVLSFMPREVIHLETNQPQSIRLPA